jgi:hypothetical protein
MNAAELIAYRREHRQGEPEGDLRDPRVLADLLTMLLEDHLARIEGNAQAPTGFVFDSTRGRVVPTIPGKAAPAATEDRTACALASLVGFLLDAT